jgi:hypothetical protein
MIEKHYGRWLRSDDHQLAILTAAPPDDPSTDILGRSPGS